MQQFLGDRTKELTPSGCRHNQTGNHFFADYWRVGGRRRADQALDYVIGDTHNAREIWWLRPGGSHHHAETHLLLQNALQVHHIQVTHDGAVDYHNLIALNDS